MDSTIDTLEGAKRQLAVTNAFWPADGDRDPVGYGLGSGEAGPIGQGQTAGAGNRPDLAGR